MGHRVALAIALLSLGEVQKTGMALRKNGSGTCHRPRPDMFGLSRARARGRVFYRKMETDVRVVPSEATVSYLGTSLIDRKSEVTGSFMTRIGSPATHSGRSF